MAWTLDRETTIDYQARHHEIDFILAPYYDSAKLDFKQAQKTLELTYRDTVLKVDANGKATSALDPQGIRPPAAQDASFPGDLPIVSKADDRLTIDVEGMVANPDGSWALYYLWGWTIDK